MSRLTVHGAPNISGNSDESLKSILTEPNTPMAVAYSGREKLSKNLYDNGIERYKGEYGSFRYLYRDNGTIVGALKVVVKGNVAIVSTVFVERDYRGKGIAKMLVSVAKKDFKTLEVDSHLTQDGARFFGVGEGCRKRRISKILSGLRYRGGVAK
jgi:predicted GNAT family acetyltransferase